MSLTNINEDTIFDTEEFNGRLMGNIVRMPFEVHRAHGAMIHTTDGEGYLDFWGDEGVCSLGYNTVEYRGIVQDFMDTFAPHQLPDVYPHKMRQEAADIICNMTGMDRIFFANSGTEANEAAIKIARKYWWDKFGEAEQESKISINRPYANRHTILTITGNFHGRTGFSNAAGDPRVSPYHHWGFGPRAKGFGVLDETIWKQVVTNGYVHDDVPHVPDWDSVAAVIFAPVLGNNVVKTYTMDFWRELSDLRKRYGFLIIHDDVQAGSGRAGYPATYQSVFPEGSEYAEDVKPDILCLGKGMALGHPMSAMLASEKVAKSFTPGVHFNTFGGSPFVCYLAMRYYQWLEENLEKVRAAGESIRARLYEHDWIDHVDGAGLLNAFTPAYKEHGYDGFEFCHMARDFGLSLVTHRRWGPIRFTPPMNVTVEELDLAFQALEKTHDALIS